MQRRLSVILIAVASTCLAQGTSEHKEIKLPHAILATYVGTYELQPKMNMTMTLVGDQLFTQLAGQPKFPVFPESETKFFLRVVDAQVEFFKDANGKVTDAILHQNGNDLKVRRISDTVLEHKAITVKPEILSAYAGTYQTPQFPLVITFKDGHLTLQAGPQPEMELFPESETSFFLKTVDAQLDFVRADGKVTGLVFHVGPQNIEATRQ